MKISLCLLIKRQLCQISSWDDSFEPEIERSWRRAAVGEDETESCDKLLKYFHALYEKHPRSHRTRAYL